MMAAGGGVGVTGPHLTGGGLGVRPPSAKPFYRTSINLGFDINLMGVRGR